jgi:hypothetical protein
MGDSLSLIKEYPQKDFKEIIYNTLSGIFAEDDLKYLIGKLGEKSTRYIILCLYSPRKPYKQKKLQRQCGINTKIRISYNSARDTEKHYISNRRSSISAS